MAAEQLFIGIDSGTQGTKVIVFSRERGEIVSSAYVAHEIIEDDKGKREQEPAWWVSACSQAMMEVISQKGISADQVKAIGVSGQQHGMVPLDEKGHVIRPAKLWCDTETVPQCEELTAKMGGDARVIDIIGNIIAPGFTAPKILWLKQNEPENYQKLKSILLPHDYLNYWLTGEKTTESGDASGTAYFDITRREWSEAILDAIDPSGGLIDCLPTLIESGDPCGEVKADICERFGFSQGVLVSSGGGDNMMAAIGTGNVVDGTVTASLGTSGTIFSFSSSPVIDRKGELAAFCSSSGGWLPLVCTMNVTVSTELTRELFQLSVEELNRKVSQAEIGSQGIVLLPYFNGERTPQLPNARATLHGLSTTNFTAANLCRAAMEGATFGLKYGLEVMRQQGISPREIRLVGGGAKSAVWRQMVADIFDCPVICPRAEEAGAFGAAIQAMWCYQNACGQSCELKEITDRYVSLDNKTAVEPRKENADRYSQIYDHYLKLNQSLLEINHINLPSLILMED